jgi:hypothetical protein
MLFDLRGRRRRAVQATYLTLAVLMGGGLVLFGIGGDVSGGLFDAFSDRSGGGSTSGQLEDRIDRLEERLADNPQSEATLKALVRDNHALAGAQLPTGAVQYPEDAMDDLRQAAQYWQRYLDVEDGEPDASLARLARARYRLTCSLDCVWSAHVRRRGARALTLVATGATTRGTPVTIAVPRMPRGRYELVVWAAAPLNGGEPARVVSRPFER